MILYQKYPYKEIHAKIIKIIDKREHIEEYQNYAPQYRYECYEQMRGRYGVQERIALKREMEEDFSIKKDMYGDYYRDSLRWRNNYTIEAEYVIKGKAYRNIISLKEYSECLKENQRVKICYDRNDPSNAFCLDDAKTIDEYFRTLVFSAFSLAFAIGMLILTMHMSS